VRGAENEGPGGWGPHPALTSNGGSGRGSAPLRGQCRPRTGGAAPQGAEAGVEGGRAAPERAKAARQGELAA